MILGLFLTLYVKNTTAVESSSTQAIPEAWFFALKADPEEVIVKISLAATKGGLASMRDNGPRIHTSLCRKVPPLNPKQPALLTNNEY